MTEPTQAQILRTACQSALDALGRNDTAWAAAQLNTALTAAAGVQASIPSQTLSDHDKMVKEIKATMKERCALKIEEIGRDCWPDRLEPEHAAAAIRALKDKP
jgi:hypothetical protein